MEALSGIVSVANILLCLWIGVRVLRLARSSDGPERWLGLHFVVFSFFAATLSIGLYMGWSDPSLRLSSNVERGLNGTYFALSTVGIGCLYLFVQRTFRAQSRGARRAVVAGIALLGGSALALGITEGFEVRVLNGWPYWTAWIAREAPYAWMAVESLLYWRMLRKRLVLGLADPILTNRFLLWTVWALAVFASGMSDPLARFWYYAATGTTTTWIPEEGRAIVVVTIALTSALGIVGGVSLFLAFFPTAGFRRRLQARAARFEAS